MATIISAIDIQLSRILTNPATLQKYNLEINFKKGVPVTVNEKEQEAYIQSLINTYPDRYFDSQEKYQQYLEGLEELAKAPKRDALPVVKIGAEPEAPKEVELTNFDANKVELTPEGLSGLSDKELKILALQIGVPFASNISAETLKDKILKYVDELNSTPER